MNDVSSAAGDRAAYAGFWRRFGAYAIDYLLMFAGSAALAIVATLTGLVPVGAPEFSAIVLAGYFLYCSLLESSRWQATIGKRVLGIRVTSHRGERIGFGRAAARFAAKLLSGLTLCLGYLLFFVTKRHQALHDLIAGTLVALDHAPSKATR